MVANMESSGIVSIESMRDDKDKVRCDVIGKLRNKVGESLMIEYEEWKGGFEKVETDDWDKFGFYKACVASYSS